MRRTPTIRRFVPTEWPTYRDLRLRALAEAPDAFGTTLTQDESRPDSAWAERLEAGSDPRWNESLLAEFDSEPCGLAWGRIEPACRDRADLYQMWVEPRWRRRGTGRLLLEAVITWARGAGAQYLALGVTCGAVPANRLYLGAGFKPVGDPEPLRPGSRVLAQEMRLELREDAA